MPKSATDVMHDIIFSAVVDAVSALKTASGGVPNALLRDINAIHANATFADLPRELQASVTASVRTGFNRLLKEGYAVSPSQPVAGRPAPAPVQIVPRNKPGGPAPTRPVRRPDRPRPPRAK